MKHIFIRLLSLTMVLLLLATAGCGKQEPEIDAQAMLESLLNEVAFNTELEQVGSNAALYFPTCPKILPSRCIPEADILLTKWRC